MSGKQKPPVVVAELGRPETAAETAARKSRDSRLYRQRKTVNNLVFSLLVSLGLVIVIVLVVPRGTDTWSTHSVDAVTAATQNSASAGHQLIAPEVPEGWLAKQAELRRAPSGDISYWYIGYTTSSGAYAAVVQAFTDSGEPVDETWIAQQLESQVATGVDTFAGHDWTVYDHRSRNADQANMLYGLQTELPSSTGPTSTLLVYGTDSAEALRDLAEAAVSPRALRGSASSSSSGESTTSESTTSESTTGTDAEGA